MQNVRTRTVTEGSGAASPLRRIEARALMGMVVVFLIFASGCKVGPNYKQPEIPVDERFMSTDNNRIMGEPANPREWWKVFNDPVLDSLIEQASQQNLDVQAAGLRILESRITRTAAYYMFAPAASLSGSGTHKRFSENIEPEVEYKKGGVAYNNELSKTLSENAKKSVSVKLPEISVKPEMDMYQLGVDALWELDIWGKNRRRIESNSAGLAATIADYDDILVSLTGEVAIAYIEIRTYQRRLQVARESIALLEGVSGTARKRAEGAAAARLDSELATALLRDTQATVPLLELALEQARNGLCVLLGKTPHDLDSILGATGAIPAVPSSMKIGAPADLLRRRPDVRLAERQAAAQCARIGIAKAGLYPSFSLFGGLGWASSDEHKLIQPDSESSVFGGMFKWNILLYPLLQNNVRIEDVRFHETMLYYKSAVLRAVKEVENASVAYDRAQDRLPMLASSAEASRNAVTLANDRYATGSADFMTLMRSLEYLVRQNDSLTEAQGQVALAMVATYKALGGGWEIREGKEVVSEEIKEQMRKETDWWSLEAPAMLRTNELMGPAEK